MVAPEAFEGVPPAIRDQLRRRDCRIPQWKPSTSQHNLLWGEFERRGQRDLVVLCARHERPRVNVMTLIWQPGEQRTNSTTTNEAVERFSGTS
jgi:hypothetical protein